MILGTVYFHLNRSDDARVSVAEHLNGTVSVAVNAEGVDIAVFLSPSQFEALRRAVAAFEWKPEAPPAPETEGEL